MDRWNDPLVLHRDHDTARRLLLDQGLVFSDDPAAWASLREIFTFVFLCFHREIMARGTLALVYCYDQDRQPPRIARCDGFCSISERLADGRRVSSIGVSVQALHYDRDYSVMLLLHELAHTLSGFPSEHGPEFHAYLDGLIRRYNRRYCAHIKNDYHKLPETAQKGR